MRDYRIHLIDDHGSTIVYPKAANEYEAMHTAKSDYPGMTIIDLVEVLPRMEEDYV